MSERKSKEVPVRVVAGGTDKHRTETRVFAREIHESYRTAVR